MTRVEALSAPRYLLADRERDIGRRCESSIGARFLSYPRNYGRPFLLPRVLPRIQSASRNGVTARRETADIPAIRRGEEKRDRDVYYSLENAGFPADATLFFPQRRRPQSCSIADRRLRASFDPKPVTSRGRYARVTHTPRATLTRNHLIFIPRGYSAPSRAQITSKADVKRKADRCQPDCSILPDSFSVVSFSSRTRTRARFASREFSPELCWENGTPSGA